MKVESIICRALNVELSEPFGIATGVQARAENALVTVVLEGGHVGLGEAAPFPAVNGETQAAVIRAFERDRAALVGLQVGAPHETRARIGSAFADTPSALAALEMALLDARCRAEGRSMFDHFGGHSSALLTDITVPTGGVEQAEDAARRAMQSGFRTLKLKVGGAPFARDAARLRAIAAAAPRARLLLDANASLEAEAAIALVAELGAARGRVVLFEQPCLRGDFAGARRVRAAGIKVAADEDARSVEDVVLLAEERAADTINFKVTKCGLSTTLTMIERSRELGFELMMGGMVETRLAMSVSACIAGGYGGFAELDLDTPLFMLDDGLEGGFSQLAHGPHLDLGPIRAGHGVNLRRRSE